MNKEQLEFLKIRLDYGEYDGDDIMNANIAITDLIDLRRAVMEWVDCDTAAESRRAQAAMVRLAKQ